MEIIVGLLGYLWIGLLTALVAVNTTMPLKPGVGAAIWWPITWIWFIFHSGLKFIDWANEST